MQGKFHNAVHAAGTALKKVNVTRLQALLLDIRKNEKDYLLRGDEKYINAALDGIDRLQALFIRLKSRKPKRRRLRRP